MSEVLCFNREFTQSSGHSVPVYNENCKLSRYLANSFTGYVTLIAYRFLKDCLVVPIRVVVPTVFVLPIYRLFSDKVWLSRQTNPAEKNGAGMNNVF